MEFILTFSFLEKQRNEENIAIYIDPPYNLPEHIHLQAAGFGGDVTTRMIRSPIHSGRS